MNGVVQYGEVCATCGIPCDLHLGPADPPVLSPHSVWGDRNKCRDFVRRETAYGGIPGAEQAARALHDMAAAYAALAPTLRQACLAWAGLGRQLRGILWRRYHEEGCAYGETRAGLARWCQQRELLDLLGYDYPTGRWHR